MCVLIIFVVPLGIINQLVVLVMFQIIIYIICIIWWILCVILLFKVWGMCNDVNKIKNQIDRNDDFSTRIDFLLRIGEKEKAKEILINRILSDESIFNTTSTPVEKIEEICERYKDELETLGIQVTQFESTNPET